MILGPIGFAVPWLLWALVALPILWIILRAVPPAPIRRRFPGVALLLGLKDEDSVSDRTPWWLLLLRMLAVAAVIVGLAGPALNPRDEGEARASGPLLILMDGSWASARDWAAQTAVIDAMLAEAGRDGRPAALMQLSDPQAPVFQAADSLRARVPGLIPAPWAVTSGAMARAVDLLGEAEFETRWFSDGLDREGRMPVLEALEARGPVTVHESPRAVLALTPPTLEDGPIQLRALRGRCARLRSMPTGWTLPVSRVFWPLCR